MPNLGLPGFRVVDDLERSNFTSGLLEMVKADDGITGVAVEQDDRARAGRKPDAAVHVIDFWFLRLGGAQHLPVVVKLKHLHASRDGCLSGAVVSGANLILCESD